MNAISSAIVRFGAIALIAVYATLVIRLITFNLWTWYWAVSIVFLVSYLIVSFTTGLRMIKGSLAFKFPGALVLGFPVLLAYAIYATGDSIITRILVVHFMSFLFLAFELVGSVLNPIFKATMFLSAGAVGFLAHRYLKRSVAASVFLSISLLYAIGLYLLGYTYYHLPLDHNQEEVAAQQHVEHIAFDRKYSTSRKMLIDDSERYLYCAFTQTTLLAKEGEDGLLKYDIQMREERAFYPNKLGDTFILRSEQDLVYVGLPGTEIVELSKSTLSLSGKSWKVDFEKYSTLDSIALLDDNLIAARIELTGKTDLLLIDSISDARISVRLPYHRDAMVNVAMEVVPERKEVFLLQTSLHGTRLFKIHATGLVDEKTIMFPGVLYEISYNRYSNRLFAASMTKDKLYEIDPDDLSFSESAIPNGVREIVPINAGKIALGDYCRGKIYLYDTEKREIEQTFLTGRKPEAMALGPRSGKLYVVSSFGLTIFDLPAIYTN